MTKQEVEANAAWGAYEEDCSGFTNDDFKLSEHAFRSGFEAACRAARRASQPNAAVAAVERLRDDWKQNSDTRLLREVTGGLTFADKVLAALRTLPSAPEPAQEPRAWIVPGGAFTLDKQAAEAWRTAGLEVTPLYTSPPDHAKAVRVLAEALEHFGKPSDFISADLTERASAALSHPAVQAVLNNR